MSAIVAKALNSSVGTVDFVGVDEILKQISNHTKKISNQIFWYSNNDKPIARLNFSGSGQTRYITFPYGGMLRFEYNSELAQVSVSGSGLVFLGEDYIIFSPNARIGFKMTTNNNEYLPVEVNLLGHTKFAPEISYIVE